MITVETMPGIVVLKTREPEIAEAFALASQAMLDMILTMGYPIKMRKSVETTVDPCFESDNLEFNVRYRIHPFIQSDTEGTKPP